MPHPSSDFQALLQRREAIREEFANIGELRPGSLKSR